MIGQKTIARFQSQLIYLKKMNFSKHQVLLTLRKPQGRLMTNAYSNVKEVSHASARNVSTYPDSILRKYVFMQHNEGSNLLSMKEILFLTLHRQNPNYYYSIKVLRFHPHEVMLKNFFFKFSKKLLSLTKKAISKEDLEKQWGGPDAYKLIIFIKDDFKDIVNKHPSVIVFFSAEWCQHCLRLRPHFGTAALMAKEANLPIAFATFDVTSDPDVADDNGVVGIPTVKYYKNGKVVSTFRGKRTADDLFAYVKNPLPPPIENKKIDL